MGWKSIQIKNKWDNIYIYKNTTTTNTQKTVWK